MDTPMTLKELEVKIAADKEKKAAKEVILNKLLEGLNVPFKSGQVSTLGGVDKAATIFRISLDAKETWINDIFHNSRYAIFDWGHDGKLECISAGTKNRKFRKCTCETVEKVIEKINKFIASQP